MLRESSVSRLPRSQRSQTITHLQITASVFVSKGRQDIGLNVKLSKKQLQVSRNVIPQVMGYARRSPHGFGHDSWEFSPEAVDVLHAYKENFPTAFSMVGLPLTTR